MNSQQSTSIITNRSELAPSEFNADIYENRQKAYFMYSAPDALKCSIVVTACSNLEKTKYCVECILKYVEDISYELILIANGCPEEIHDYFQSVDYENKTVIKIEEIISLSSAMSYSQKQCKGEYIVYISNDVYLTKNALANMLFCLESDPKIGNVMAMSSNVSNGQQVNFDYSNLDEMQEKAAIFNKRDSSKWEERMRLISLIVVFRREVIDTVGMFDPAFIHDFGEDDFCMRLRRAGYKSVLCCDTWVCHDHDFRNLEGKNPEDLQESLKIGKRIFSQKYHGIDAWSDINNFEYELLSPLSEVKLNTNPVTLCVDVCCGNPVLEIRNRLRKCGIDNVSTIAFTTQAKYLFDLQTVASEVCCDKLDFIQEYYAPSTFDIIAVGEPINAYDKPISALQTLFGLLKSDGVLLFKVRNTDDYNAFLRMAGLGGVNDSDLPSCLSVNEVAECVKFLGGNDIKITSEYHSFDDNNQKLIMQLLQTANPNAAQNDLQYLMTRNVCFCVIKK
jgi:glycosyltransferase involved in cell wall biosynthesis